MTNQNLLQQNDMNLQQNIEKINPDVLKLEKLQKKKG